MTVIIKSTANKQKIKKVLETVKLKGKLDAFKHCGVLKLREDPLVMQKKLRDEWR